MLRTVTLNSGYDDVYEVGAVHWGGVTPIHSFEPRPAGKGINVATLARSLGSEVCAYALVGEREAVDFGERLSALSLTHRIIKVPGRTRHNLTLSVRGSDQIAAHMVSEGFTLSDRGPVDALVDRLIAEVQSGDIVTLNGSVPHGLPDTIWADLAKEMLRAGARLIIDLQGAAFLAALRDNRSILLAKPNEEECRVLPNVSSAVTPEEAVVVALNSLSQFGVAIPLVTIGAQGCAYISHGEVYVSSCPVPDPRVAVGAGDAFLAGFCSALASHEDPGEAIFSGLSVSSAYVSGQSPSGLRSAAKAFKERIVTAPGFDKGTALPPGTVVS